MESHWIERESRRAKILARGNAGRVRAAIADALNLASLCRLNGSKVTSRGALAIARYMRIEMTR